MEKLRNLDKLYNTSQQKRSYDNFKNRILFGPWQQSHLSKELRLTKAPIRAHERKMDEVAPRHLYQVSACFIP